MTATCAHTETDIAIVGGGLAGLTLAIHLRQRIPNVSVHVIERREHPVREAAFKVGESTVEIGAHYLAEVLGLREHLDTCHIRKFGFRFFFSDGREDVDRCLEVGASRVLPTPTWQIDRGRLENHLGELARSLGVQFETGAVVRHIELGTDASSHQIEYGQKGKQEQRLSARWLIDASGRAGLLKRKLGLARPNDHEAHAVWWRVTEYINPNDWSNDEEWLTRCDPPERWRSTNHMCGPGYWVWLIPLASGSHSIGIVCDSRRHTLEQMNTHAKAMQWLQVRQPRVALALARKAHALQDFNYLPNYSYDCAQVISGQRWAITGEAGCFLDPFYSPGTDFIAIANTFIVDLVKRDLGSESFRARAWFYQRMFASFYENMLTLYRGQYHLFGNIQIMPLKILWDYSYYWALLAPLFFAERLTDIKLLNKIGNLFEHGRELNRQAQNLFRQSDSHSPFRFGPPKRLLDQHRIEWFYEMNRVLDQTPFDDESIQAQLFDNIERLRQLAVEIKFAKECSKQTSVMSSAHFSIKTSGSPIHLLPEEWHGYGCSAGENKQA